MGRSENEAECVCVQVFITCSVMLCEAGTDSRCAQGCNPSVKVKKRETLYTSHSSRQRIHKRDVSVEMSGHFISHSHKISEREASSQTSGHFVSQGPVRLRHQESDSPGKALFISPQGRWEVIKRYPDQSQLEIEAVITTSLEFAS